MEVKVDGELVSIPTTKLLGRQADHVDIYAHYLTESGNPVRMLATEWDRVVLRLSTLEPKFRKQEEETGIHDGMFHEWYVEALKILPAGAFLWKDDFELLWNAYLDQTLPLPWERQDERRVNYAAYIDAESRALVYEGFEHLLQKPPAKLKQCPKIVGEAAARASATIQVGYADFIMLCGVDDPTDWDPGFAVKPEGVWVVPAPENACLSPAERKALAEHPEKDLSKPVLAFPCNLEQLITFLEWNGL